MKLIKYWEKYYYSIGRDVVMQLGANTQKAKEAEGLVKDTSQTREGHKYPST